LFRDRYGEIEATVYEDLEFIDAGQYSEAVLCPSCGNHVNVTPFGGTISHWIGIAT